MRTEARVVYITEDGTEFSDKGKAELHEMIYSKMLGVMLGVRPPKNPREYIQLTKDEYRRIKHGLVGIGVEFSILDERFSSPDDVHPHGIAGRIIDDSGTVLSEGWRTLMCIDPDSLRLYQQPYFALNKEAAKKECTVKISR